MINFESKQILGPGSWFALHLMAFNAETNHEHKAVLFLIKLYSTKLFCGTCQKHFNEFIKNNPPKQSLREKGDLFYWTWKAHNNANELMGKQGISFNEAKRMYGQ